MSVEAGLHFVEFGSGTPVLALPGLPADHRFMVETLEPVFSAATGYRRVYPDLPGTGKSAAAATIDSTDAVAEALVGFIDAVLGNEEFLLIGQSYGGYLARSLASRRRSQVLGVALICPLADPLAREVPPRTVERPDPALVAALTEEQAGFGELVVVQTTDVLRRFTAATAGQAIADQAALARIRERYKLAADPEAGPVYDRPVLILTGRQDHVAGYTDQARLLGRYPHATFAVLDQAGHMLAIEQPELLAALLQEWLTRCG